MAQYKVTIPTQKKYKKLKKKRRIQYNMENEYKNIMHLIYSKSIQSHIFKLDAQVTNLCPKTSQTIS